MPGKPELWRREIISTCYKTKETWSGHIFRLQFEMHPGTSGVRTGNYRKGTNEPVFNDKGESKISVEDTAVALLDETEKPHYIRKRFTVAW